MKYQCFICDYCGKEERFENDTVSFPQGWEELLITVKDKEVEILCPNCKELYHSIRSAEYLKFIERFRAKVRKEIKGRR